LPDRSLGATVVDGIDAYKIDQHFPDAALVVWGAPHGHVASLSHACSPEHTSRSSNDMFNLMAFHMLGEKLPGPLKQGTWCYQVLTCWL